MNSHFRRDYIYNTRLGIAGKVKANKLVRYLKYNRKTKEYLFASGLNKNDKEVLIAIPHGEVGKVVSTFKKLWHIDYNGTDGYKANIGNIITNFNQLHVGGKYKFTILVEGGCYISKDTLTMVEKLDDEAKFIGTKSSDITFTQSCNDNWLDQGIVIARLVG